MLDARTGKVLVENNSAFGIYKFKSGLTREQYSKLQNSGKKFEILHNHPASSPPSTADIQGLFNRENAVASTVICHDGTIYRMEKLKQFTRIDEFVNQVYNDIRQDYIGYPKHLIDGKVTFEVIRQLEVTKFLKYRKVT